MLLVGCATTDNNLAGKTVCPKCRDIPIEFHDPNRYDDSGVDVDAFRKDRVAHSCPDCQDAFVTFFKEGKFKHKCTVCEANGYVCPMNHPVKGKPVKIER